MGSKQAKPQTNQLGSPGMFSSSSKQTTTRIDENGIAHEGKLDRPIVYWDKGIQLPYIAIYDNFDFLPSQAGALFTGFGVKRIIDVIERDDIVTNDKIRTGRWDVPETDFWRKDTVAAFYYEQIENIQGGNLFIDADLLDTDKNSPDPPDNVAVIPLIPRRCVVLRGNVRYKIEDWKRLDPNFPARRKTYSIIGKTSIRP